jgi:hypothetical protein
MMLYIDERELERKSHDVQRRQSRSMSNEAICRRSKYQRALSKTIRSASFRPVVSRFSAGRTLAAELDVRFQLAFQAA